MADVETAVSVIQYGGGGMVSSAVLYKIWHVLRGDQRKSRIDAAADELRADMARQIDLLKQDTKMLIDRCDEFASQRNEAVATVGRLQATVDGLREVLEDVRADRTRMQRELADVRGRNDTLLTENIRLQATCKALAEMLTKLTGMPAYDWNNVIEALPHKGK